ncbi:MAG: hypothetical protein IC227_00800 [Enterococcus lacertideformus]|uniref:Uncharacterized protein n=1 Tax=Enterococcus lacertideformus TaxID=2771493 RepID=A0A931AX66_9ENTE|nr:hypothetical protein [Enterococcus lacertideformus]
MEVINNNFEELDRDAKKAVRDLVVNRAQNELEQAKGFPTLDPNVFDKIDPRVVNLGFAHQCSEKLKGRMAVFGYEGNVCAELPWDNPELSQEWNKRKEVTLTPAGNLQRNEQELMATREKEVVKEPDPIRRGKKTENNGGNKGSGRTEYAGSSNPTPGSPSPEHVWR